MANQITHIVLAGKVLDQIPDAISHAEFLIGTVFPDIRYLGCVDRGQTHFKGVVFNDVLTESNPFLAGMKYHSLSDEVREKYMVKRGAYDLAPSSKLVTKALKTYEDEVLYENFSQWDQVVRHLDIIAAEEEKIIKEVDQIRRWHVSIQEYFREAPTDTSRKKFALAVGLSAEVADEINNLIMHMRREPRLREIIVEMYQNWVYLIR